MLNLIPSDGLDTVLLEPSICKKKKGKKKQTQKTIRKTERNSHFMTIYWPL